MRSTASSDRRGRSSSARTNPTADWLRLGGSYFALSTATETWGSGWEVTAWRMPLTKLTEELAAAGFLIERLIEPAPDPALEHSRPETFERLSCEPAFILFKLGKLART